jgi:ABC-type glutathione transport system ATPase component
VQRQILDLLLEIQMQTGIIYIFITHSPLAAKYMSSQVLSLKDGQIEFYGRAAKWFSYSGGA